MEAALHHSLWDAAKAALREQFIAIDSYTEEQERSQISNVTLCLREIEREQTEPKVRRRKEIIK